MALTPLKTPDKQAEKRVLKVAVRDLISFVLRSGDLRHGAAAGVHALEGIYGHQRLQKRRGKGYRAEVAVRHRQDCGDLVLEVGGRLDGVFETTTPRLIEEIKTTRGSMEDLSPSSRLLHLAQAKVYAYLYAAKHGDAEYEVRVTYLNLESFKTETFGQRCSFQELATFFKEIVAGYLHWARKLVVWQRLRNQSIAELSFPHGAFRPGQRRLSVATYRAIRQGDTLFVQAPTGIGKTDGVLFPALKALGEDRCDKLFFLTAKTVGAQAAERAIASMRTNGLCLKSLTITARDKICFNAPCDPEACEYAMGYYDRIKDALEEAFEQDDLTRERVEAIAVRQRVCPFEFSLDLAAFADVVICDFNYAFDPGVYLRRFFGEPTTLPTLLVDEAHNLVDRARDMHSAEIEKSAFLALKKQFHPLVPELGRCLTGINRAFLRVKKEVFLGKGEEQVNQTLPKALTRALARFCRAVESWLPRQVGRTIPPELLERFFEARRFLRTAEGFGDAYAVIYRRRRKRMIVKIYCLDPSASLRSVIGKCKAAVFFSATLTPFSYFTRVLGGSPASKTLRLGSAFHAENLGVFVASRIATRYRRREATHGQVVCAIGEVVRHKPGHYLVYFPSYLYLQAVHSRFEETYPHVATLVQQRTMSDSERLSFLKRFHLDLPGTLVGFAVMGGVFGEAIDLRGDRLIGVVVVGVGLPALCLERDLIRDYFQAQGEPGFEFAYQYPGMNRVLQTAGRVIRSETDRGVVCLIDERFQEYRYRRLFPGDWQPQFTTDPAEMGKLLADFWKPIQSDSLGNVPKSVK